MFDSHCHLQDLRFEGAVDALIERAREQGVQSFMLAGVDPEDWQRQIQWAARHDRVFVSYGLHPWRVAVLSADACVDVISQLGAALRGEGLPVPQAVGEMGLDALTPANKRALPQQELIFREQLRLARSVNLPVILHILKAHGRALEILREEGVPAAGGVVHSYSGSAEQVPEYVELGLSISFAGGVTHPAAKRAHAAVKAVPLERLLVETDAPDQRVHQVEEGLGEPAHLLHTVEAVAKLRGVECGSIERATAENARRLYGVH